MDMYSARRGYILEDHTQDDVTLHTDSEGNTTMTQGGDVLVLSEGQMLSLAEYYHRVFGLSSVDNLFETHDPTDDTEPLMPLYGTNRN